MRAALFIALAIFTVGYIAIWVRYAMRAPERSGMPSLLEYGIGFVTNFFDALGIGSFATTTALFRWFKVVPDEKIPGTLNAGATIPGILEAFIFIAVVDVDVTTLTLIGCGVWVVVEHSLARVRFRDGPGGRSRSAWVSHC